MKTLTQEQHDALIEVANDFIFEVETRNERTWDYYTKEERDSIEKQITVLRTIEGIE